MLIPEQLSGLKVAILGAAREGTALAGALARWGAQVTLCDSKPAEALSRHLEGLESLPIHFSLGAVACSLDDVDVLFLSPGVPPTAPMVREARQRGLPLSSEPRLFLQLCEAPVIGITGSSGKTTTTTLVGRMLAADVRNTWVGGNIGIPLIGRLVDESAPEMVVMELSSFQLELFSPDYQGEAIDSRRSQASRVISIEGWSPHVAAVTNITPNHLDRHPSMDAYVHAKTHVLAFQESGDWAVLNADDPISAGLSAQVRGNLLQFSLEKAVDVGAFLSGENLTVRDGSRERDVCATSQVSLRGRHNLANIVTALCCASAVGADLEAMRDVATSFRGVAHRLEGTRVWHGVSFINDSIATSPERAVAALQSFAEPVVLLAGGRDKHLPWDEWARVVKARVRIVVAFGEASPIIERALADTSPIGSESSGTELILVPDLDHAVATAATVARPGDVVLLSPGGTSFDAFEDFEARGHRFATLVAELN